MIWYDEIKRWDTIKKKLKLKNFTSTILKLALFEKAFYVYYSDFPEYHRLKRVDPNRCRINVSYSRQWRAACRRGRTCTCAPREHSRERTRSHFKTTISSYATIHSLYKVAVVRSICAEKSSFSLL